MRAALVLIAVLALAGPVTAQAPAPDAASEPQRPRRPEYPGGWTAEKCRRYGKDWSEALGRFGRAGLSPAFLERHEAFVAGGCIGPADVCPRSARELDLANVLVIRAMNAGMASTFLPFACGKS